MNRVSQIDVSCFVKVAKIKKKMLVYLVKIKTVSKV